MVPRISTRLDETYTLCKKCETYTLRKKCETYTLHKKCETYTLHKKCETYALHKKCETYTQRKKRETYTLRKKCSFFEVFWSVFILNMRKNRPGKLQIRKRFMQWQTVCIIAITHLRIHCNRRSLLPQEEIKREILVP